MHWQRLDRDSSIKIIDSVKSDADMGLFAIGTSEVQRARVPFYKDYTIYKVTNYASLPSFTFEYLGDGVFFHYLDGTEEPVHTVNDKGALNLDKNNVIDYLTFYFEHVATEEDEDEGDIVVIKNPNDMPLLNSLDPAGYDAVFNQHKPAEVHYDGGFDAFEVETDLYRDSQLVRAKIEVSTKGRVTIKNQKMVIHEVMDTGFTDVIM